MIRASLWLLVVLCLCGCVNRYHRITAAPTPPKDAPIGSNAFNGIRDHLEESHLHVMQIHGMGDHSARADCGKKSENVHLQTEIASRLGYQLAGDEDAVVTHDILKDGMVAGTYSVRMYTRKDRTNRLYFSCITWGETGKVVKGKLLELRDDFREEAENEKHRALINSLAKRFVNGSFADPVIYLGGMGPYIRDVVWQGIMASTYELAAKRATPALADVTSLDAMRLTEVFAAETRVAIISDSLGSRIVFDLVCEQSETLCQDARKALPDGKGSLQKRELAPLSAQAFVQEQLEQRVVSMYMLANQLPLLELAYFTPPGDGVPLDVALDRLMAGNKGCYRPVPGLRAPPDRSAGDKPTAVELVAFTDPNDALSYHLTDAFAKRCILESATGDPATLRLVNVTLPNTWPRYLFVYSDLVKAHSSGFKENRKAIDLMTFGHH